jgi:hypothetical protein
MIQLPLDVGRNLPNLHVALEDTYEIVSRYSVKQMQ